MTRLEFVPGSEHLKFVSGSDLERLALSDLLGFNDRMKEYYTRVSGENPALVALDPPYGIKDVKAYLDSLETKDAGAYLFNPTKGVPPRFAGEAFLAKVTKPERMVHIPPIDVVAGFLTFVRDGSVLCETHLVVGESYEGKGIGSFLLRNFVRYAKEARGISEVRFYNFTVGGYATFRRVERELHDPALSFESVSSVKIRP